jgi:hypothetical protein
MIVAKGHVDKAMVGKGGHGRDSCRLLSASLRAAGHEKACIFAPEVTLRPLFAGLVPESPPLGREVAVSSGNTKKESVVSFQVSGV